VCLCENVANATASDTKSHTTHRLVVSGVQLPRLPCLRRVAREHHGAVACSHNPQPGRAAGAIRLFSQRTRGTRRRHTKCSQSTNHLDAEMCTIARVRGFAGADFAISMPLSLFCSVAPCATRQS